MKETIQQQADKYGISKSSVSRARRSGIDTSDAEAMLQHLANRKHGGGREAGPGSSALVEWRRRKLELECQRIQLSLDIEAGKYVLADDVRSSELAAGFFTREVATRWFHNDLPPRLGGRDTIEVSKILRDVCWEFCTELANGYGDIGCLYSAELAVVAGGGDPGPLIRKMAKERAKLEAGEGGPDED